MVFNKNFYNLIILSFLLATCSGCSTNQLPELFPPYSTPVNQALADSGKNRPQIENFLNSFRDNPEKRQAAQFLVANLPPGDRVSLSDKLLTENIEYAFLARENTPWGQDVSWTNFLHYVLPHRVSQEQAVEWRKLFYNELQPVVSQCKTAEEAILAVNRWCFSKTGFKSTQRWDQNPLMTINRGWGRCEEAVILTVCALRSIGIPARQAMVPAWQHSDDNHTWTEVMVNGKWHYIESANPDYGLDHAWFTGSARKAPLVISYAYGRVDNPQSPIMGYRFGCTQINTTARYAPASRTQILVTDNTGTPLANTKVYISVFNYASFRPVASKTTDLNGKTDILLGPGSVLISAANGNNTAYTASTWIPGEQEKRENVELKLSAGNLPEGNILFRFAYNDKQAATAPPKNSEGAKKAEFDSLRKKRIDKLAEMSKKAKRVAPVISETISGAGLNVPQLLNALHLCPEKYKASLIRSIKDMPVADLVKITHEDLISNVVLAETAREEARNAGLEYDDKIFDSFVLSPRIMYEQLRPWREKLHSRFKLETNVPYTKRIEDLANFTDFFKKTPRGPIGSSIDPLGVFDSRTVSTDAETCIFATAALRSSGIPARYLDEQGWVEFYDGIKWQPFYPGKSALTGNRNATAASTAFYSPWQSIRFSLSGFEKGKKAPHYFKDFTISQLNEQTFFSIIEKNILGKMDKETNIWELSIPTKELYLISAKRNSKNEPQISIIKIRKANHNQPK